MEFDVYGWLMQSERRQRIITDFVQPLTAKQLANRVQLPRDSVSYILYELLLYDLVKCLNWRARRSRVYWLTDLGINFQRKLRVRSELPRLDHDFPTVDWDTYGWVCYSHRTPIIKTLDRPMRPATIKRRAKTQVPNLKMSANNVRDVIRLFRKRGVVRPLPYGGHYHPRYELTELGRKLRVLLLYADF